MRTRLAAALCGVALTAGTLLSAPAASAQASAYPTTPFDVTVGNTYTRGTITWYGRSVNVSGEIKAADAANCRGTAVFTLTSAKVQLGSGDSATVCTSAPFSVNVEANVPGGAAIVRVCLDDGEYPPTYYLCKLYGHP
jgi:polyisoprenoid-binding protein YceI